MLKPLLLAAVLAASSVAHAQNAPAASAPPKPSSPAKKALVAKVLQLQQPAVEMMARQLAEQPAVLLLQQAGQAVQQRVPADKREAIARDIQADARKYADEAVPIVRDRAVKLQPSTVGSLLEERFDENELKQIVALLESPVNRKYQQLGLEMQKVMVEKLVAETRPQVDVKIKALEQSIARRLDVASTPASAVPGAPAAPSSGTRP